MFFVFLVEVFFFFFMDDLELNYMTFDIMY
jgi:hypothetical protein